MIDAAISASPACSDRLRFAISFFANTGLKKDRNILPCINIDNAPAAAFASAVNADSHLADAAAKRNAALRVSGDHINHGNAFSFGKLALRRSQIALCLNVSNQIQSHGTHTAKNRNISQ